MLKSWDALKYNACLMMQSACIRLYKETVACHALPTLHSRVKMQLHEVGHVATNEHAILHAGAWNTSDVVDSG